MKNNKILLINPWIYDFAAYDFWIKPLGLLSVGALLEKFGYETYLVDCLDRYHPLQLAKTGKNRVRNHKYGTGKFHREAVEKPAILSEIPRTFCRYGIEISIFEKALSEVPEPDVILVTSIMTYWYPGPFKAIELLRKKFPKKPIVLGGIYATLFYEHALNLSGADYVITGKGELQTLKLIEKITNNNSLTDDFPKCWKDMPDPIFHHYMTLNSLPIMTSKGCPFNCSFCASRKISGKFEQRDPQRIIDQIIYYYKKRKIRHFAFFDDALLIDPQKHICKILKTLIDKNLSIALHTPNGIHAREIKPELAELMYRSNFKTIRLSYESSNKARQHEMNNKVSDEALISALNNLEKAGYHRNNLDIYIIMGLPGQNLDEVVESMIFVNSLGVKVRLTSFSPIPGTIDWERSVKQHNFPEDADPLLTNNTIFPLRNKDNTFEHYAQVRYFSKMLNNGLDQGISLFNKSKLAKLVKSYFVK